MPDPGQDATAAAAAAAAAKATATAAARAASDATSYFASLDESMPIQWAGEAAVQSEVTGAFSPCLLVLQSERLFVLPLPDGAPLGWVANDFA